MASAQTSYQPGYTKKTWQISQTFKPPKRGAPPASAGGSTRGMTCLRGNKRLTSLIPPDKLGLTLATHPTFFWYIPVTSVKTARFLLLTDNSQKVVYETTLQLPNQPGIISFTLPESVDALEVGKSYNWYLNIVCDAHDFSGNPGVNGWVERVQPELPLSTALETANLRTLPTIYAEAGIWHEALTSLVELRRAEPNSLSVKLNWRKFFTSVKLDAIASEPFLDCCTSENSLAK
ncbi:DUF928 domain-containing protein [Nodularia sp. UHCC 0506]|uniref:DUF928 domain-containing protein n=1 Tax=Nodularia sp. UHCC 0506 TaxID=3110243 RepID=UPI002B219E1E|nr:DUF928 domain-containing protein [Nodularia sp. UHCC 0506]MEA5513614.1 DUF928 domain-containing protein [Nodularia sp. UHCC 0506]